MSDARLPTPESLEVKRRGRHRLIGAITLAVLAVVIIPMVLDSEPRKVSKDLPLSIPAKEGLPPLPAPAPETAKPAVEAPDAAKTAAADAPATPAATAAAVDKPADKDSAKAPQKPTEKAADKAVDKPAERVAAKVAEKPAEKSADKSAQTAKVAESKPAQKAEKTDTKASAKTEKVSEKSANKAEGFAIQLGAFSDAEKLAALKAKMKTAKVPVFTETVKTASGSLTRLRAGPYKTREQADKALVQVKKAGVDGQVIPLP
ncbi:MAG: SPOR domain-containing protein [Burkholderiales bacterium]|nr:SPOR domain-containing protein [Burkholderiales bacterium]